MNKRIRKKQFKRTLRELVAAYDEYEAAHELTFRRAVKCIADVHLEPREETQFYLKIASLMASSGSPPRQPPHS